MAEHDMLAIQPVGRVGPSEEAPSTLITWHSYLPKVPILKGTPLPQSLITICELSNCTPADSRLPGQVLSPWALSWQLDLILGDLTYEKWVLLILSRKIMGIGALKKASHLCNRLRQTEKPGGVEQLMICEFPEQNRDLAQLQQSQE